ncbi:MAG: PDZ domain-containing protein, partial [Sinobacterium sp.]|nr:PDZ domain-containing protein [Sinobacterium sp.]
LNTYENYIQTDAAINVGSSRGALTNTSGELIGINTANYTQSGGSQGIALATPVETIYKVVTDIIQHGYVIRGWLGLEVAQLTPELALQLNTTITHGIVITRTQAGSPAQLAGLQSQDIIISIDGKQINSGYQGLHEVADLPPGRSIEVEVLRKNKRVKLNAVIGTRPAAATTSKQPTAIPVKAAE